MILRRTVCAVSAAVSVSQLLIVLNTADTHTCVPLMGRKEL